MLIHVFLDVVVALCAFAATDQRELSFQVNSIHTLSKSLHYRRPGQSTAYQRHPILCTSLSNPREVIHKQYKSNRLLSFILKF